jgi:chromosome segregation ATPase
MLALSDKDIEQAAQQITAADEELAAFQQISDNVQSQLDVATQDLQQTNQDKDDLASALSQAQQEQTLQLKGLTE